MARHKLRTDSQIKALPPGRHGDGDGLWLYVQASGSRSWVFIYVRHGVRKELGLGSYGAISGKISLTDARARADEAREIVKQGGDPSTEMTYRRRLVKSRTFGECAEELIATKQSTFKNAEHKRQWRTTLTQGARSLWNIPIRDVSTDNVVRVLRPIWTEKRVTASRLRGRIEATLDYAKAIGLREGENPARWKGHLDHVLGRIRNAQRRHHAAMPYSDVPGFMERLRLVSGTSARALELCVLTATRSGETIHAEWPEFDLDAEIWTIPASRMKAGKEHIIPLTERAVAILRGLHELRISEMVFPGRAPRRPISKMAMTHVMRRLGLDHFTVHGFRSSFRDWAGDQTNFPRDIAEMALAHKVGDETEQAYRRSSALAKRRKLMEAWASYVSIINASDNVVAIRAER